MVWFQLTVLPMPSATKSWMAVLVPVFFQVTGVSVIVGVGTWTEALDESCMAWEVLLTGPVCHMSECRYRSMLFGST